MKDQIHSIFVPGVSFLEKQLKNIMLYLLMNTLLLKKVFPNLL